MHRRCFFKCINNSHNPIELPHNKEIIVGRSKYTKIKDQTCSRQQISLEADCENCVVQLKQLGPNPSGLDGFATIKDSIYKIKHGSRIELLLNNYFHIIEFDPAPEKSRKRKMDEGEVLKKHKKRNKNDEMTGGKEEISSVHIETIEDSWEEIDRGDLYIFTSKGVKPGRKIAAFDMDGTLIKTKSGKVHPVDTNDWQLAFPQISQKLTELLNKEFRIVIFSNQSPIGKGRVKIEDFKKKVENIVTKLKVPLQAYIATGKNFYRKPTTGMWKYLTEKKNGDFKVDMSESFYCGDAAGRAANWAPGKKKDHSMADKLMAENLNLKFYTPEEFFLGHSMANVPINKPEFIPKEIKPEPFDNRLIRQEQEILVLVGYPGSGKTFLARQIEKKSVYKYVSVCRDILGSWQKCAAEASKLLKQGKSVIVDSTNPEAESRARWTKLAKESTVECRCAKLITSKAHAQHNNKFRELMKINHVPVNDIVFHTYKNKFVEPTLKEGFKEVIEVKFNPCFDDKEAEQMYYMHLLEK